MAEPHVVTALVAKRAELSGELAKLGDKCGNDVKLGHDSGLNPNMISMAKHMETHEKF